MHARAGYSLIELLVAVVVTALVGAGLTRLMTAQSQFLSTQEGRSGARAVSRTATGVIMSELRMTEANQGVVAATPKSVTIRVPFAMGLVCGDIGGGTVVAAMPADSMVLAEGGFDGYAWRSGNGVYTYVPAATLGLSSSVSTCLSTGQVDTIPGGRLWRLAPNVPAGAGTPVLLYKNVVYSFLNSVLEPGWIGLWRSVPSVGLVEELVAPFDTTASFGFFVDGSATALGSPPALDMIRGLELRLTSVNQRDPAAAAKSSEQTPLRTAVFFKNR